MKVPKIIMPKIRLAPFRMGDLENVFRLCSAPETSEYAVWEPHKSRLVTLRFLLWARREPNGLHWCAFDAKSGEFIGTCSLINIDREALSAELGYSVCKPLWGNGYAGEMCRALIRYGFERLALERIYVRIMEENRRSLRVAEKLGFTEDGAPERVFVKEIERNVRKFVFTREEFQKNPQKNSQKP